MALRKNIPKAIFPPDAYYYKIQMRDGKQRLSYQIINDEFINPPSIEELEEISVSYLSFINDFCQIEVLLPNQDVFILNLFMRPMDLNIACTCGMPDGSLCYHSYVGLYNLMWRHGNMDVGQFYWPGYVMDDKGKNKFLNIEISLPTIWFGPTIWVEARSHFGNLFKPELGFRNNYYLPLKKFIRNKQTQLISESIEQHNDSNLTSDERLTVVYLITGTFPGFKCVLMPAFIPCIARLDKTGGKITSFKNYLDTAVETILDNLTPNQKTLNEIALTQMEIIKEHKKKSDENFDYDTKDLKSKMFELWEQVIPLLSLEKFVFETSKYFFETPNKRQLKKDCRPIRFSNISPTIAYTLIGYNDYFRLVTRFEVNGKPIIIPKFYRPNFLIYDTSENLYYRINNLKDDDLLTWFYEEGMLTIQKKHFNEFLTSFLKPLSLNYQIYYRRYKSKKLVMFNEDMVRLDAEV